MDKDIASVGNQGDTKITLLRSTLGFVQVEREEKIIRKERDRLVKEGPTPKRRGS